MLQFRDKTIYEKSKYTIILRQLEPLSVEIEYLSNDSCWHLMMPFEDELKEMEDSGQDIKFWSKYRKWQKRKRYTQEEFDRIFIND